MKHNKKIKIWPLSLIAVVLFTLGLSTFGLFINPKHVSAATTTNYIFDTPTGSALTALKQAVDDQEESDAAFAKTKVYAKLQGKNGPYLLTLNINTDRSGCAQASHTSLFQNCNNADHFGGQADDVYVYSAKYYCEAGSGVIDSPGNGAYYTVDYNVSLKLGKTGEDHALFSGDTLNKTVKLHWVGFGSTNSPGVQLTPAAQTNSARTTKTLQIKDLPAKCQPPNVPRSVLKAAHDDTEESNNGIINLDIYTYPQAPDSVKKAWDKISKDSGQSDTLGATTSTGSSGDSGSSDPSLNCHIGFNLAALNPLNWLLCGAIKGMVSIIGVIDDAITQQLAVGTTESSGSAPTKIFCETGNCKNYKDAWKSFRNIALGLMVIVGLVVIMSTALGFEYFDPYTIKKTLPRLVIAAIGISLSWQLMAFFVELTNALGFGIRYLIYQPFSGLGNPTINLGSLGSNGVTLVVAAGAIAFGGFGLLTLAGTGALALFIAFLVLILRQIAIIMLIVLAPIGILAYVLPNTQKVWKFWWESFSKALLMFPMIAGLIAAGKVFSAIAASDNTNNVLNQMIAFAAYFAPFFMIPFTFKFAGSFMGQVGGFINSRSQGGFNYLKQKRRENAGRRIQRARQDRLWRTNWGKIGDGKYISNYANSAAGWLLDGDEKGRAALGKRGPGKYLFGNYRQHALGQIDDATTEHIQKAAQKMKSIGPLHYKGERALAGLYGGLSAETQSRLMQAGFMDAQGRSLGAPQSREQINQLADIMALSSDDNERASGSDLRQVAGVLGNINKDPEMSRASGNMDAVGALMLASSGRMSSEDQAEILTRMHGSGREGLAERMQKATSEAGSRLRPELRHGHGVIKNADGSYTSAFADPTSERAVENVLSMKQQELNGAKGETIDQVSQTWAHLLGTGPAGGYIEKEIIDGRGKKRKVREAQWSNEQEVVRQQIMQTASQYSGEDPSAKRKVLDFLDKMSQQGGYDYRAEYNQREQRGYDPAFGGSSSGGPQTGGGGGGPQTGGGGGGPQTGGGGGSPT